ncbi:mucin-20 [Onychomys torridus]|uniref:mucin-20 n=1 Tax=Onychomys torridus TaxID=38674 RepID=UPI00167FC03E|nr:mucin-20 [Onychomys torridus]
MGFVWVLAVPLLFFCGKPGVTTSSAGLGSGSSALLMTTNNTEVPAFTQRDRTSAEEAFQTTPLTQDVPLDALTLSTETASSILTATSTSPEVNSRDTQTISPVTETGKTQTTSTATTSPTASTLDIQTTSPTASTLDIQTTSPTTSILDIQTTFPTTSTLDIQTTSPTASTLDIQTTSPTTSILDIQTTSPTTSTLDVQTTSPTASTLDIQTTSPTTSTLDIQTSSPTASTLDIQTTSPAASTLDTQTTFPATEALENQTIFPVDLTLKTQTVSSITETRTLAIRIPSNFMVVHPILTDTSTTRGSPRTGMSTVKTGTLSDPIGATIDTLCIDDSSEEARKITIDLLTLAHTSTEAEHLSSESSSSSDSSAGVLTSSQVLGSNIATPAKDLVAFSITHIKLTTCITEIETSVITSNTNNSPTGATAVSTSETLTLPQSSEAKPLSPKTTSSPGTPSTAGTSTLATTLEGVPVISSVTERETTEAQTPTSGVTSVIVSTNPLKETSTLSTATQRHTEVLGTTTVPRATGSTTGEATSFTSSSTSDNSPSAGVTTKSSTTSETLTSSSLAKTTTSPKTPMELLKSTPTAAWARTTKHDPGEDGGFLLVRLSVTSPEDLTEPKAIEKLMDQLSCELRAHTPLVQVSLLSVRRG